MSKQLTFPEVHNRLINNPNIILRNPSASLTGICKNIQRHKQPISNTVVAIVTDCTRPLYRSKENNYIVQVKVIDESLNDQNIFGVMCKDCTIYLLSKNRRQLELVSKIGEIVILDKFTFMLWNGIKLEAKYLNLTEGFYTIDEVSGDQYSIKRGLSMNPQLFQFSVVHKQKINELKKWRHENMHSHFQPKLGINILNNHCAMIEPFNILLKVCQSSTSADQATNQQIKNKNYSRIVLTDSNGNIYNIENENYFDQTSGSSILNNTQQQEQIEIQHYIIDPNQPKNSKKKTIKKLIEKLYQELNQKNNNQRQDKINEKKINVSDQRNILIMVRGIKQITPDLNISLTQTGMILGVLYNFPNSDQFMNYMAIHREGQKCLSSSRTPLIQTSQISRIMEQEQLTVQNKSNIPLTMITQHHSRKSMTYLNDLLELQDRYNHSSKKEDIPMMDSYLTNVIIVKFKGNLSMYHREYQILLHSNFFKELATQEQRQCKQLKKIGYIYEGRIFAIDRSTQSKGKIFEIRIFNCDQSGTFIQDNKPFLIAEEAIDDDLNCQVQKNRLKKMIEHKLNGLCKNSNFQKMASMVLEPIRSEKLLFRLVNTKVV